MEPTREALETLVKAEKGLRSVLKRALAQQRYRDVATVARLADALTALLTSAESETRIEGPQVRAVGRQEASTVAVTNKTRQRVGDVAQRTDEARSSIQGERSYPYFVRDGERLVKVGWSKRDHRVYEHRAPREAVFAFARALAHSAANGAAFAMEELLPIKGDGGAEIPSYQAYLALTWFRSQGAVERRGKDGYVVRDRAGLDPSELTRRWDLVPVRD